MAVNRKFMVLVLLTCILTTVFLIDLLKIVQQPYEITKLRNSLISQTASMPTDVHWTPEKMPADFLQETTSVPIELDRYKDSIAELEQTSLGNWDKALAIGRHLLSGPSGGGGGIKSSTLIAYKTIIKEPRGYCADYTQVFNAFAYMADVPVREWGMSFDQFSGFGHAFNEIYDYQWGKWIFIDTFHSFYVVDAKNQEPLSALEFRQLLTDGAGTDAIGVKPIRAERYAFKSKEDALVYYRRGIDRFSLIFGNNVLTYDAFPLVTTLGRVSRAVEQAYAIIVGIHPQSRILPTAANAGDIDELFALRNWFFTMMVIVFASWLLILVFAWMKFRPLRRVKISD